MLLLYNFQGFQPGTEPSIDVLLSGENHLSRSQHSLVVYSSLCKAEASWAFPHHNNSSASFLFSLRLGSHFVNRLSFKRTGLGQRWSKGLSVPNIETCLWVHPEKILSTTPLLQACSSSTHFRLSIFLSRTRVYPVSKLLALQACRPKYDHQNALKILGTVVVCTPMLGKQMQPTP